MKKYISWEEYDIYIEKISRWVYDNFYNQNLQEMEIGAIYGLPRGGLPIAVSLSHTLKLPLLMNYYDRKVVTHKKILVVDDIADTGETLEDFDNKHNVICTFHYHKQSLVNQIIIVKKKVMIGLFILGKQKIVKKYKII